MIHARKSARSTVFVLLVSANNSLSVSTEKLSQNTPFHMQAEYFHSILKYVGQDYPSLVTNSICIERALFFSSRKTESDNLTHPRSGSFVANMDAVGAVFTERYASYSN